jgi:hypothetical protein
LLCLSLFSFVFICFVYVPNYICFAFLVDHLLNFCVPRS